MALVVFLRGVNVGGHRTFRPAALAGKLRHLGAVNIGAAGTFVIHRPAGVAAVRAEVARRLPFETEIMICRGRDVSRLVSRDDVAARPAGADIVRFVSVLARRPRSAPAIPLQLPVTGDWQLRILAREDRFVIGEYRRRMQAIGWLGRLDALFGQPVTTRSWRTMEAIARVLAQPAA